MDFTAYITLCLILVAPSCHSTREAKLRKRTWTNLNDGNLKDHKYLALLKPTAGLCSGSIPSKSTVLTFCEAATDDGNTKAYAGFVTLTSGVPNNSTNGLQERTVETVAECPDLKHLKICILNENWAETDQVGFVTLRLDDESKTEYTGCLVLGFGGTDAAHKQDNQTIGASTQCSISEATKGVLYSVVKADQAVKLEQTDFGGPAVCGGVQRAINKGYQAAADGATDCNLYIDVATYSPWIKENIPQDSGENQGPNGNNTVASTGSSIHGYMKKNSEWKVLLLCLIIIKFLVY